METLAQPQWSSWLEVGGGDAPPEASEDALKVSDLIVFVPGDTRNGLLGRKQLFQDRCLRVAGCKEWMDFKRRQKKLNKATFVSLPNLTKAGLEPCLQYVETGSCRINPAKLCDAFDAAVFLDLGAIAAACVPRVITSLNPRNAWRNLENGLLLGTRELIEEALEVTVSSLAEVLDHTDLSASWITSGAIMKVLKRSDLAVNETVLAEKVLQWADATEEPRAAVQRVARCLSWGVVYEDDRELFKRALELDLLPAEFVVTGDDQQPALNENDLPESMQLRCYAFRLRQGSCSPFHDVGPSVKMGPVTWKTFEGSPRPDGLHFDTGGYIEIPDPRGRLDATKHFSVEVWVRYDVYGQAYQNPIACKAGMGCGWEIRASNYVVEFMVTLRNREGDQWHELVAIDIDHDPEHWYHLVGTFDGSAVMLYVDGSSAGLSRLPNWNTNGGDHRYIDTDCEIVHFDEPLCIGQHSLGGWKGDRDFEGDMCGLSISTNRVLVVEGRQ